jgi:hypothetical protein
MSQVKITAEDLTTGEKAEKTVNRGGMRNLQYFLNGIVLYDDFQDMFPESNKAFTDLDMVMESAGYLISVEFKHTFTDLTTAQYLLAKNLAQTNSGIFLFVFGDLDNPDCYFTVRKVNGQAVVSSTKQLTGGRKQLKQVLKNIVEWTEKHPLVETGKEAVEQAKREIKELKMQYFGI